MLNDLMWVLFAHLALLFIFVAPTVALVWVAHVFVKALKHRHARVVMSEAPVA